jgi:hypothetical protein
MVNEGRTLHLSRAKEWARGICIPHHDLLLSGPQAPHITRRAPPLGHAIAPGLDTRTGGCLTWPAAEGGYDGQDAHDAEVRDPRGTVLWENGDMDR